MPSNSSALIFNLRNKRQADLANEQARQDQLNQVAQARGDAGSAQLQQILRAIPGQRRALEEQAAAKAGQRAGMERQLGMEQSEYATPYEQEGAERGVMGQDIRSMDAAALKREAIAQYAREQGGRMDLRGAQEQGATGREQMKGQTARDVAMIHQRTTELNRGSRGDRQLNQMNSTYRTMVMEAREAAAFGDKARHTQILGEAEQLRLQAIAMYGRDLASTETQSSSVTTPTHPEGVNSAQPPEETMPRPEDVGVEDASGFRNRIQRLQSGG